MKLQPNAVAAIALLPEVLQVQKVGGGWKFQFSRDVPDATLALCNADGEILSRAALPASGVLPAAGDAAHATSVKLFAGKYLLDAAQLP
jgi:hypothetical protein